MPLNSLTSASVLRTCTCAALRLCGVAATRWSAELSRSRATSAERACCNCMMFIRRCFVSCSSDRNWAITGELASSAGGPCASPAASAVAAGGGFGAAGAARPAGTGNEPPKERLPRCWAADSLRDFFSCASLPTWCVPAAATVATEAPDSAAQRPRSAATRARDAMAPPRLPEGYVPNGAGGSPARERVEGGAATEPAPRAGGPGTGA
mmetsp:Transcript_80735/g.233480  ORF Transcript_80735/g.233480 Transcript_80735/m.233480 type:complete len:209 (-) Transcript_80735:6-632(-)